MVKVSPISLLSPEIIFKKAVHYNCVQDSVIFKRAYFSFDICGGYPPWNGCGLDASVEELEVSWTRAENSLSIKAQTSSEIMASRPFPGNSRTMASSGVERRIEVRFSFP